MPNYFSPGVYVQEIPSAIKPIAGVSTTTAAFIGIIKQAVIRIPEPNPNYNPTISNSELIFLDCSVDAKDEAKKQKLREILIGYSIPTSSPSPPSISKSERKKADKPQLSKLKKNENSLKNLEQETSQSPSNEEIPLQPEGISTSLEENRESGSLGEATKSGKFINTENIESSNPTNNENNTQRELITDINLDDIIAKIENQQIKVYNTPYLLKEKEIELLKPSLCTNFTEFQKYFGDFSANDEGQIHLAHAVYGFFNNGGSRCYAIVTKQENLEQALKELKNYDDISLVAVPGQTELSVYEQLTTHCQDMGDRFAIFDGPSTESDLNKLIRIKADDGHMPNRTSYGAWYFPWIEVRADIGSKAAREDQELKKVPVPPSGHIIGVYARVDNSRGVFKAPANESIYGALGVTQRVSKAQQEILNPKGVNCIRVMNNNILVWGARTIGANDNYDTKHINVRRTLLFLKKSIDEGSQWVVFEANTPSLWAKIIRNISAFLTIQWRAGALFGDTPEQAFYIKCDEEINPPEIRELGQVIIQIGVAIARPAEFVIFRVSQQSDSVS